MKPYLKLPSFILLNLLLFTVAFFLYFFIPIFTLIFPVIFFGPSIFSLSTILRYAFGVYAFCLLYVILRPIAILFFMRKTGYIPNKNAILLTTFSIDLFFLLPLVMLSFVDSSAFEYISSSPFIFLFGLFPCYFPLFEFKNLDEMSYFKVLKKLFLTFSKVLVFMFFYMFTFFYFRFTYLTAPKTNASIIFFISCALFLFSLFAIIFLKNHRKKLYTIFSFVISICTMFYLFRYCATFRAQLFDANCNLNLFCQVGQVYNTALHEKIFVNKENCEKLDFYWGTTEEGDLYCSMTSW